MKKVFLLFVAAALAACSAEPVETERLDSLDAAVTGKKNVKAAEADYLEYPETACAGEETVFTYHFNGKENGKTPLKVDLWGDDPDTEEVDVDWYPIDQANVEGGGPIEFTYIFDFAGSYSLRYQIGGGQPAEFTVVVENCGCEETFTYNNNEDGTYTFTYIPEEDMDDAELVFTFAQSVEVTGLDDWTNNGKATSSTETKTMDLEACEIYTWTVTLEKDCSGNSGSSNVWTDFKVNNMSKKNENTPNITENCS